MQNKFKFFGTDEKLNAAIKKFFIRLVVLIVAWQLLYNFVLKPTTIPDKILTETTTWGAMVCINTFLPVDPKITMDSVYYGGDSGYHLMRGNRIVFVIADACNGLDLFVIYVGLIVLLPFYKMKRKIAFIIGGLAVLLVANIARVTLLYWIYFYHRPIFQINHKYIFTLLLYLIIFCGWLLFTKKGFKDEKG